MATVQVWGCKKCPYTYNSPVRLSAMDHHCLHNKVAPAVLLEGLAPRERVKPKPKVVVTPPVHTGRVLKRRRLPVQ